MTTILFLHGWGGNADSFAPVSQYFARACDERGEAYRVLAPSLPCPPAEVYTLEDYADDADRFLQDHQVARCVVVAHSFGARLVAVLNARHPKLFTKIVITGGAGLRTWRLGVWLKIRWHKLCRRLGWRGSSGSADYRGLDANGKRTFQNVVNRDLTDEVKQITAPTLLIWGARDKATPMCQCRRFGKLIPQAQKIVYPHAGHFAYWDCPARFIGDVSRFLGGGQYGA